MTASKREPSTSALTGSTSPRTARTARSSAKLAVIPKSASGWSPTVTLGPKGSVLPSHRAITTQPVGGRGHARQRSTAALSIRQRGTRHESRSLQAHRSAPPDPPGPSLSKVNSTLHPRHTGRYGFGSSGELRGEKLRLRRRAQAMDAAHNQSTLGADPIAELTEDVAETARILFSARSVTETLRQVIELAAATIEGCDFAGIFLVENDVVTSPIHNDPLVDEVDDLQNELGEGPCLDAIEHRLIFYAGDLVEEDRWPQFSRRATAAGIRSVLALPLPTDGESGALNLYARFPGAFGVVDRAKAVILASLAGLALSAARSHEDEERLTENLNAALATREIIGQAQGILMERERVSSGQAFDVLRRASQHLNRKLRDVAQDLVDTGERPDTGTP